MVSTWYIDPVSGLDANAGTSWAAACQTATGISTRSVLPGDTIRVAKTPDPTDVGQTATWTSGITQSSQWKGNSTLSISSSTNANPIVITTAAHTLVTGDYIGILNHTTNTNANGIWQITVLSSTTFSIPIAGNGVGGATGTIYKISNQMVTLTTAPVVASISNCDTAWTNGTSCVATVDTQANSKEGLGSAKLTITTPATTLKLAYVTLTNTDYSSYNQISFWIKNSVAVTTGQYTLNLCSDTIGATVVNTVAIPAIPSTNQWVAFTLDTGAALGTSIQSVALYTGATTGTSNVLNIDHIIACLPSSNPSALSLTSLVGKNNGVEGWFCIRFFSGKAISLDHGVNSSFVGTRGFYGVSETVELWKRETFKQPMQTGLGSGANVNTKYGSSGGGQVTYSGGWNISTNTQDGATYWDGQNGLGAGLTNPLSGTVAYYSFLNINFSRFGYSLHLSPGNATYNNFVLTCFNITNCVNVFSDGLGNGSVLNINNATFLTSDAFIFSAWVGNTVNIVNLFAGAASLSTSALSFGPTTNILNITNIVGFNNGFQAVPPLTTINGSIITGINGTAIVVPAASQKCVINTTTISNCTTTGISLASYGNLITTPNINNIATGVSISTSYNNTIKGTAFSSNTTDIALSNNIGANYFIDGSYNNVTVTGSADERFYVRNPSGVVSARCYSDNMTCQTDLVNVHTSGNRSWNITTSRTTVAYPATLDLGYVVLQGSVTNTITIWVRRDNVNMSCGIQVVGNQIEGMTTTAQALTSGAINTWVQVTLTISSATQSGPVILQAYAVSSSGTQNAWFTDIAVS